MSSVAPNAEIISSIASYAYWGANRPGVPLDLRTVHALALTCRAFLEPALDQLWRRQLTLFNLAKTLPKDAWEVYNGEKEGPEGKKQRLIKSTRLFIPKDWPRFNYYAAKIRELGYDPRAPFGMVELAPHWRAEGVPIEFVTNLCIVRAPYELVPQVRRVRWTAHEAALGLRAHVYMFLNAPLAALALEFPDPPPEDAENPGYGDATFVKYTLKAAAEQCPAFREVELVWPQFEGYAGALSDFLKMAAAEKLRAFVANVREWKEEDLARLAALPELRRTRLYLEGTQFPWLVGANGLQPFPSLVDLTLEVPSLDRCTAFLGALAPCKLERLAVISSVAPSTSMLHDFLFALSAGCDPSTLRTLSLSSSATRSESASTNADCLITSELLAPLTLFPALRALTLDLPASYALHDTSLPALLTAWPALEALSLGGTHGWGERPLLTFAGLAQIVQVCPMLETLCIAIDASRGEVLHAASVPCPNERVGVIDLGESCVPGVEDEAGVVALSRNLAALFPMLERINAKTRDSAGEDMQGAETEGKPGNGLATEEFWRKVEKQVAGFAMLKDLDIPMDLS